MTFEEAKKNQMIRRINRLAKELKDRDTDKLAEIISNKVCRKITCSDCAIRHCSGLRIESPENIKTVIEWSGIKIPKRLRYLYD